MTVKNRLEYTLVAEGYAEYAFIPVYMRRMADRYAIQAVKSKLGLRPGKSNKSEVYLEYQDILKDSINRQYDLFIVGVDLNEPDREQDQPVHRKECDKLIAALGKPYQRFSNKIVLYVPVQAIEYWLIYQLHKVQAMKTTVSNSVKSAHQDKFKEQLYKNRRDGDAMQQVAKEIAEKADFDELAKQSCSFCHFHEQVTAFLTLFSH
ncbi:hypothetical protein [uncultured Fibrella sp.]|uniref:hypothetical protein n=1 Tax=uncultured Fibrella sp. TaxID=1284596 RepID=UPI0035CA60EF